MFPEEVEAGPCRVAMIEYVAVLLYLCEGRCYAEGRPVRSVRRNGLDDIGDSEDCGPQQDIGTVKTLGVARTVEPFVMLKNDIGYRVGKPCIFEYVISRLGMGPYQV